MASDTAVWTANDLDSLPDDGNRYEVVGGELFVTPAPSIRHQALQAALFRRLDAHVRANGLGWVFCAPADLPVNARNRVQPDLLVLPYAPGAPGRLPASWADAPRPLLVVEILSHTTARRDRHAKRELYVSGGIPTYWMADGDAREVVVVRPGERDASCRHRLEWKPEGGEALSIDLVELFAGVLGAAGH